MTMDGPIEFTVHGIPVPQPRQRHRIVGKGKNAFVQNYTPRTLKESKSGRPSIQTFKARCRIALDAVYQGPPLEGPVRLGLTFILPRPQRLRGVARVRHDCKPDLDNLQKAVMDSLIGKAWKDDGQVCLVEAVKYYASANEEPHVFVFLIQARKESPCLF